MKNDQPAKKNNFPPSLPSPSSPPPSSPPPSSPPPSSSRSLTFAPLHSRVRAGDAIGLTRSHSHAYGCTRVHPRSPLGRASDDIHLLPCRAAPPPYSLGHASPDPEPATSSAVSLGRARIIPRLPRGRARPPCPVRLDALSGVRFTRLRGPSAARPSPYSPALATREGLYIIY